MSYCELPELAPKLKLYSDSVLWRVTLWIEPRLITQGPNYIEGSEAEYSPGSLRPSCHSGQG